MAFAVPLMAINTFFAWVWLCVLQVKPCSLFTF
jgi:hypothetical protein